MKKSTGHKPVLIGLGIYLVGFVLFVSISHLLEVRAMDAEIDGRLDRGARSISMILGQENLDQLLLGETDEAEYARLVRELTDYTQMHGLTFLYVLQMKNGEVLNTVTSATAEEWSAGDYQANGEQYPEPNEFMILALNGGKVQRDELRDQWGHLRSMYIPFNGGDLSRYILCADLDIVEISAMQIRNLLSNILTGLVFLIFALPLFLLTSRNLSAQRNALAMEVEEQTARITELNADLQKRLEEVEEQAKITHQALQEAEQAKYDALRARQVGSALAAEKIDLAVIGIRSVLEVLAGKIAEAGQGSATQAGMIATTSHEVARINSSIGDVARNAQTASELSGNISVLAGNSAATASSAVESMHAVDRETQALHDNMNALGEHAQAIVQIISIISDVADQTNLLALNAAIEAARAGEAGRGFAVVADEVRKLAERTSVSTTEVGKVIEAVRQGSQRSLEQTDVAIEAVAKARNLVQESGEAFAEIRRAVEQAAQEVRSIAVVSNQQSSVSASISQAMGEVDSISDQTSSLMLEADKALKELSRQAEALTRLVEELKRG